MPSTLKDIARELGLSPATVSRALNGFPEVNENTRIRVAEQAERLGYRPNQLARKLVTGRSGIIALVVPHAENLAEDASFFGVVAGLSTALAAHDLDLMLHVAAAGDHELVPYHRLISKGVIDGFIFNSPRSDDPRIALARKHDLAFVVHGRAGPFDEYAYYDIDNHHVSAAAVTMLTALGHRRIALINGPEQHAFAKDRRTGFLDTLSELGIQSSEAHIAHGALTEQHGYSAVMRTLEPDWLNGPTAYVCGSVQIAAGALRATRERGLRVPQDISIIAHDDHVPHYHSSEMSPALTVTSSPLTAACRPLAELLMMQLSGNPDKQSLQKRVLPNLIVRQSTGPAPLRGPK